MIPRVDRLQIELPAPSDPDPAAAAAVQELLGGRGRTKVKPYYDLIANIAAEEYGHIELVST
jgi:Mn-containing catalase